MAIGDAVLGLSSVDAGNSLTLQPGAGEEWVIHAILMGSDYEVYRTDGSNPILISTDVGDDYWDEKQFHLTNSIYFTIKNISVGAAGYGYEGMVTK